MCTVLTFQHMKIRGSLSWSFPWGPKGLPECGPFVALTVTDFWNLHGQLQTLTGLMTFKKAAVNVTVAVAVIPGVAFIWGVMVPVRGAANIDTHSFTRVREHQQTIQKLAEQTGEDKGGAVLCWKKKERQLYVAHLGTQMQGKHVQWCAW